MSYEADVHRGIQDLFDQAAEQRTELDIDSARWVIFSGKRFGKTVMK